MKIGILTFHRSHNYGAFLQCYSLTQFLKNQGYDVSVINFNNIGKGGYTIRWSKNIIKNLHLIKRYFMFNKCQALLPLTQPGITSGDFEEFRNYVNGKFDLIITGSDEVWRTVGGFRDTPNVYWLLGDMGAAKMAYAISSRADFSLLGEERVLKIKKALWDFSFISMRDSFSQQQVQLYTDKQVHKCCDPVFLSDVVGCKERGKKILKEKLGLKKEKTIAIMGKEPVLARAVKEKFKDKADVISLYDYNAGTVNAMGLNPFEWVDVISAVDFMLTNYFHGMCFCIKNNTPFYAIDMREKVIERGKMYDLLKDANMLERFISRSDEEYILKALDKLEASLNSNEQVDFSATVNSFKETAKPFSDAVAELLKNK